MTLVYEASHNGVEFAWYSIPLMFCWSGVFRSLASSQVSNTGTTMDQYTSVHYYVDVSALCGHRLCEGDCECMCGRGRGGGGVLLLFQVDLFNGI
jgi:hypothetical protein